MITRRTFLGTTTAALVAAPIVTFGQQDEQEIYFNDVPITGPLWELDRYLREEAFPHIDRKRGGIYVEDQSYHKKIVDWEGNLYYVALATLRFKEADILEVRWRAMPINERLDNAYASYSFSREEAYSALSPRTFVRTLAAAALSQLEQTLILRRT
jgi:hypothetical protein